MNPSVNAGGGTQTGLNIGIGGELNKSALISQRLQ